MADVILKLLQREFRLSQQHSDILGKGRPNLSTKERRIFGRELQWKMERFHEFVDGYYHRGKGRGLIVDDEWATAIAFSIMGKGCSSYTDLIGMSVVGRGQVQKVFSQIKGGGLISNR